MEKVLGFGGFFFRADDPAALAQWYADHLGVDLAPSGDHPDRMPWQPVGGVTIFAPFPADTTYFRSDKAFQINFRVADLDAMITQLEGAGIVVARGETMPGIGRFASLEDPEGTPIELWQPEVATG